MNNKLLFLNVFLYTCIMNSSEVISVHDDLDEEIQEIALYKAEPLRNYEDVNGEITTTFEAKIMQIEEKNKKNLPNLEYTKGSVAQVSIPIKNPIKEEDNCCSCCPCFNCLKTILNYYLSNGHEKEI